MLGPTIETARLILRPPVLDDLDDMETFSADEEAMRFLGGPRPRAGAWRDLAMLAGVWALHGYGMFSVVEKATGCWIGRLGPWQPEGWPGREVGWGLVRSAWGRGYASEGAAAAMDWAVDTLGWTDIIHVVAPGNAASIAVARKLGSTERGPGKLPAPYMEARVDVWGQTADEWRARRSAGG